MGQKAKSSVVGTSLLEKLVGWGIIAIFAVLPLVYFSNRAASYVTSKEYFFIGTVEVLAVLWMWLLLADKRYRLSKQNMLVLLPLFLFLLSLTVSGIVGVDPATSFFSIVESGTGLLLLYHAFLFGCMVTSVIRVRQKQFLKHILQANLFASVVLAIFTFFTGPNGVFQTSSSMLNGSSGGAMMGNSLLVGAYFIFSLFLTLYLIFHESASWKKVLYWIGIVTMLCCPIYFNAAVFKGTGLSSAYLFIGEARIATVALVIGLFLSLFVWLCTLKDNKNWRVVGTVGIVAMVLIGAIGLEKISNPDSSVHAFFVAQSGNRLTDWGEALKGIAAKPALGWGPENYHVVHQMYFNPIVYSPGHGNEVWALHPHNNTLEILVDGGIIGFLFYLSVLAMLFGALYRLRRRNKIDGVTYALLTGMLVAFIIQQQMIFDSIVSYVMFFSVLAIIAGLTDMTDEYRQVTKISTLAASIAVIVTVVMVPVWVYAAYLPAQKMDEFQTVTTLTSDVRIKVYQHLFHSAGSYAIDTDPEFFTDPFFYSYDAQRVSLKNDPQYQQLSSAEIASLITAVNPLWQKKYYDYHLTLSLLNLENLNFYLTGNKQDLTQAEMYARHALLLSPTDPQLYFARAQTFVYEGNTAAAIAQLNQALVINPQYGPAVTFKKDLE